MADTRLTEKQKDLVVLSIEAYSRLLKDKARKRAEENINIIAQANLFQNEELKRLEELEYLFKLIGDPAITVRVETDD